jgi:hypothetical protein
MMIVRVVLGVVAGLLCAQARAEEGLAKLQQLEARVDSNGSVLVGVAVTSTTDRTLNLIYSKCAALDDSGNVTDTGLGQVSNLKPGETAYDLVPMLRTKTVDFTFKCRIDSIANW